MSSLQQRKIAPPVVSDSSTSAGGSPLGQNAQGARAIPPSSSSSLTSQSRQRRKQSKLLLPYPQRRKKSPVIYVVGLVVAAWIFVPLYMIHSGSWGRLRGKKPTAGVAALVEQQQQQQQGRKSKMNESEKGGDRQELLVDHKLKVSPGRFHPASKIKYRTDETNLIDMRQLTATLPFDDADGGVWKQGWDVVPREFTDEEPLKVFVVPHSHCDPGWIKTFDAYFREQTSGIITSVVDALAKDSKRKFIWAEISYFEWWWREQTEEKKDLARQLLSNGQLEFVTGGWVQPDEANTELYAMEVQLQEGHDWIRETFGEKYLPKYGWSIDPFGYSPTMAYLLKKYGFEAMLIQRVHYAVKKELASKKHLEFIWRQTWDDKHQHDIFTHVMPFFSYDVPHTCGPDPSVCCQFDFARGRLGKYGSCPWHHDPQQIDAKNVRSRALLLLDQYKKKAALYRSNVVIAPLGDDFRYRTSREAEAQYTNYQAIFDYLNEHVPGVQAQFGTLSDYFNQAVNSFDAPVLKGSFFTYSDREQDYWSGYFTSRVFDKALDRKLERVLYAADTLGATPEELREPRRALSLFQHHDGVTGTAKNNVVEDYAKRIHEAIHIVQSWMQLKINPDGGEMEPCWQSDAPRGLTQNLCGEASDVFVYNPLSWSQKCSGVEIPPRQTMWVRYPCEQPSSSSLEAGQEDFKFDEYGLMIEPIKEQWMKWKVEKGGAYLFFPGSLATFNVKDAQNYKKDGWEISTLGWKRSIVKHDYVNDSGGKAKVLDFIYETDLKTSNEEWFVRFTSKIENGGVFHTDLNGFNFDTHHFRDDMPIQSQVFPMPTLACIQDDQMRMTILSEHAQGTASLEPGTVDVWLDRRLNQDDNRGLGQGVKDNVPVRTRLRVVMETEGYDKDRDAEFEITPLVRQMWEELNHPLEAFGKRAYESAATAKKALAMLGMASDSVGGSDNANTITANKGTDHGETASKIAKIRGGSQIHGIPIAVLEKAINKSGLMKTDDSTPIVPYVYMVFKRVDYLKESIETLRRGDFDKSRVPVIISIDGKVPEMVEYAESLKSEFKVHIMIHPFSCFEHQDGFPFDKEGKLNQGFKGDGYGNPRQGSVTCCKHHFTWVLKTVFEDLEEELGAKFDSFFFLEEDYVLAPNLYEAIVTGLELMNEGNKKLSEGIFGLTFDPSDGNSKANHRKYDSDCFYIKTFVSGPMVLTREIYDKFKDNGRGYCVFDDYNWDWSLVHMQALYQLPNFVLSSDKPLVKHIGVDGGMHKMGPKSQKVMERLQLPADWHTAVLQELPGKFPPRKRRKGFGGWAHPEDHKHCLKVLGLA